MSLAFNLLFGPWLVDLSLITRVLLSTLALTPLMTYWFIPLSTRLLEPWLQGNYSQRLSRRAASIGKP